MGTSVYLGKNVGLLPLASGSYQRLIETDKASSNSDVICKMDLSLKAKDKVRKQSGGPHIPGAIKKPWTHWCLCFSFYLQGLCLNNRVFAVVRTLTK